MYVLLLDAVATFVVSVNSMEFETSLSFDDRVLRKVFSSLKLNDASGVPGAVVNGVEYPELSRDVDARDVRVLAERSEERRVGKECPV